MIWPRPCVKRTNGGVGMLVRNVFNIYSSSVDFRVYIHHTVHSYIIPMCVPFQSFSLTFLKNIYL
jgi:hypothetical protein